MDKQKLGRKREGLRGPKRDGLIAACLYAKTFVLQFSLNIFNRYMAFKQMGLYWTKTRVAAVFEISVPEIRRGIAIFSELIKDQPQLMSKITGCKQYVCFMQTKTVANKFSRYIHWFSVGLHFPRRVSSLCCKLHKHLSKYGVGNSKQPQSVAAGCLWIIGQEMVSGLTIDKIINTTNVSKATIREVLKTMRGIDK